MRGRLNPVTACRFKNHYFKSFSGRKLNCYNLGNLYIYLYLLYILVSLHALCVYSEALLFYNKKRKKNWNNMFVSFIEINIWNHLSENWTLFLHEVNIQINCTLLYNLTNPRSIENHNGPFIHQHKLANQSLLSE